MENATSSCWVSFYLIEIRLERGVKCFLVLHPIFKEILVFKDFQDYKNFEENMNSHSWPPAFQWITYVILLICRYKTLQHLHSPHFHFDRHSTQDFTHWQRIWKCSNFCCCLLPAPCQPALISQTMSADTSLTVRSRETGGGRTRITAGTKS